MKTLSLKLPESLLEKLDSRARKRGESRSVLLREAIKTMIEGENDIKEGSCLDLAKDLMEIGTNKEKWRIDIEEEQNLMMNGEEEAIELRLSSSSRR